MLLKFTCPWCKCEKLELIKKNVCLTYKILELNTSEDFVYDSPLIDGNEMLGFGDIVGTWCSKCHTFLLGEDRTPLIDQEDIKDWIQDNCPQE